VSLLHITNGDSAAALIRASSIEGTVLPWRDVLHDGPVPRGLSLEEMSCVRARFVSSYPWGESYETVLQSFRDRDNALREYRRYDELVLWFEHDLYDQLQLLQLLHWLSRRPSSGKKWTLICIGEHPEVENFRGLGQLSAEQIAELFPSRVPICAATLALGKQGWEAFTGSDPGGLSPLVEQQHERLPHLRVALRRHLEQFPSTGDGLARSERQLLRGLVEGDGRPLGELFLATQVEAEEHPFMGDRTFLRVVQQLAASEAPLVVFEDGAGVNDGTGPQEDNGYWDRRLCITDAGRRVQSGQTDRSRFQPFNVWLGGVHLKGSRPGWRWNPMRGALEQQEL